MRFHALQSVYEERASREIDLARFGDESTLCSTPRPEGMAHTTPGSCGIRAEIASTVLSNLKTRRYSLDCEVDDGFWVDDRFDGVSIAFGVESHCTSIRMKAEFICIKIRLI